jgi:hypothetical protein
VPRIVPRISCTARVMPGGRLPVRPLEIKRSSRRTCSGDGESGCSSGRRRSALGRGPYRWSILSRVHASVRARHNRQSYSKTLPVPAPATTFVPATRDRAALASAPKPSRRRRPRAARCHRAALSQRHRPGAGPRQVHRQGSASARGQELLGCSPRRRRARCGGLPARKRRRGAARCGRRPRRPAVPQRQPR